mmetsp:Transcript_12276/g.37062  ORF Transcript_12276/g.37062 Transcript_12276/m.37062 type:complete len:81 (+) Transcript_12276:159-401(+)
MMRMVMVARSRKEEEAGEKGVQSRRACRTYLALPSRGAGALGLYSLAGLWGPEGTVLFEFGDATWLVLKLEGEYAGELML